MVGNHPNPASQLARAIPRTHFEVYENFGHLLTFEEEEEEARPAADAHAFVLDSVVDSDDTQRDDVQRNATTWRWCPARPRRDWAARRGEPVTRSFCSRRTPFLQVVKTAVAVVAAVLLCEAAIGGALPTFAGIAALLLVRPSTYQPPLKGRDVLRRHVGEVAG